MRRRYWRPRILMYLPDYFLGWNCLCILAARHEKNSRTHEMEQQLLVSSLFRITYFASSMGS